MYFPTSLKLVGAVLLSALVAHAVPAWPGTQIMIKELKNPEGRTVWADNPGYLFTFIPDGGPLARFNFSDSTEYWAMYETKGWEENGAVVEPVYGLTEVNNGRFIFESELPKDIRILEFGYYQGRYWVVWTN